MANYVKPLPQPDPVTQPFWDSVKAHAMKIQRCNDTGKYFFYPRGMSPFTLSDNISWEPVSGKGTLHAFTIVYNQRAPGFADEVPYVVAMIDLEEGPRMMTNLIDVQADPEHVKIGMSVEVVYEDVTDEITLPKFRPA
ncbi:MAG TPA: Zn-ribbon domain-containing OB-fold protein [Thermomicrobiales bacterium]|nr:Zn-ribbon domain-containing OB-fold protein [Thermomicrobiales bacterium]